MEDIVLGDIENKMCAEATSQGLCSIEEGGSCTECLIAIAVEIIKANA